MTPEIRVHPEEGFVAIRDQPDSIRPWAKAVPGITLSEEEVAGWVAYAPTDASEPAIVVLAALVMARHWLDLNDTDADGNCPCVCGHWRGGDPGVCEGWDDHLAQALANAGLLRVERAA